jgi:hypothetical protein
MKKEMNMIFVRMKQVELVFDVLKTEWNSHSERYRFMVVFFLII